MFSSFCLLPFPFLRREGKFAWKGCQNLPTHLNSYARFTLWWCSTAEFCKGKSICRKAAVTIFAWWSLRIRPQRCVSSPYRRFFLSLTIPFEWGVNIWRFSLSGKMKKWCEGLSWEWVGGCTCHLWCLRNPQEPHFGLFPSVPVRDTCGGSIMSFLACQPDFTEFLKNSPLREVHGCFDIWVENIYHVTFTLKDS